ncbi:unnamed protein product [Calicophoron daubneyi]|uniref:5'-nucleotidase n=1 Tax=Calicophoron daubneyi TaxID=300641 RepID=A0AAV2U1S9_CALDB
MKLENLTEPISIIQNKQCEVNGLFAGLEHSSTLIYDQSRCADKLKKIALEGCDKLQIISDFDYTISVFREGHKQFMTTHESIEMHPKMRRSTIDKLRCLRAKYLPAETDASIPSDVVFSMLASWWHQSNEILSSEPITRKMISEVEQFAPIAIRKDFAPFVNYLHELEIPLTIFSAGLGDVIAQLLRNALVPMDKISIISNFMLFNENGESYAFQEPTIHSHNKVFATLLHQNDSPDLNLPQLSRPNVILMGDSATDVSMSQGLKCDTLLQIGYLNNPTPEKLETYKRLFDIVLLRQETFSVQCRIVDWIRQHTVGAG